MVMPATFTPTPTGGAARPLLHPPHEQLRVRGWAGEAADVVACVGEAAQAETRAGLQITRAWGGPRSGAG